MIQFLRGTQSQLQSSQQVFAAGQPIFESDSGQLKIGDGLKTFANLPYVGAGLSGGGSVNWIPYESSDSTVSAIYADFNDGYRIVIGDYNYGIDRSSSWEQISADPEIHVYSSGILLTEARDIIPSGSCIYCDTRFKTNLTDFKIWTVSAPASSGNLWPNWSYVAIVRQGRSFDITDLSDAVTSFYIVCNLAS